MRLRKKRLVTDNSVRAEKRIRRAVEHCAAKGLVVKPGAYGVEYNRDLKRFSPKVAEVGVCPLGALLIHAGPRLLETIGAKNLRGLGNKYTSVEPTAAARVLRVSVDWVISFTAGFDGHSKKFSADALAEEPSCARACAIGEALRDEFVAPE